MDEVIIPMQGMIHGIRDMRAMRRGMEGGRKATTDRRRRITDMSQTTGVTEDPGMTENTGKYKTSR